MIYVCFILVFLLELFLQSCSGDESFENLYQRTLQEWHSKRSWNPWKMYGDELFRRFLEIEKIEGNKSRKLQIVEGFEEGILAIEKATVGSGEDIQRDVILSHLYFSYAYVLNQMTEIECHELALDPHSLLIGAETVRHDSIPSTFLCLQNAENSVRNAISLDATNKDAETLLQTLTGLDGSSVHERKPKEFVAELFDSFADTFDDKLVNDLGYKVPELVGSVAKEIRGKYTYVLDAGCGTGLAGRFLRPFIDEEHGIMIGVDASRKMLNIAEKRTFHNGYGLKDDSSDASTRSKHDVENAKPLYDHLIELDLEEMRLENTLAHNGLPIKPGFDLIVAADVLVYFGNLQKLLKVFSKLSAPGALLVFTCERATDEEAPLGWRLLSSGRFAHTKSHVLNSGDEVGYQLINYEEIIPRMEKGEAVRGHLFAFVFYEKDEL